MAKSGELKIWRPAISRIVLKKIERDGIEHYASVVKEEFDDRVIITKKVSHTEIYNKMKSEIKKRG